MGLVAAARYPSKFMELRWVSRSEKAKSELNLKPSKIRVPIYISTNPSDVNPQELRQLYMSCNHSCRRHRFPKLELKDGKVDEDEEAVDIDKLCVALSHSSVIVSLFSRPHHLDTDTTSLAGKSFSKQQMVPLWGNLMERVMPFTPSNGQLVGFGRAVSDVGLTAAIYDVMVFPSFRRMGLGRMIVQRIVRTLTSREIYDIAALCSEEERLFFKACGFGDDILGSTTMMYTQRP